MSVKRGLPPSFLLAEVLVQPYGWVRPVWWSVGGSADSRSEATMGEMAPGVEISLEGATPALLASDKFTSSVVC